MYTFHLNSFFCAMLAFPTLNKRNTLSTCETCIYVIGEYMLLVYAWISIYFLSGTMFATFCCSQYRFPINETTLK